MRTMLNDPMIELQRYPLAYRSWVLTILAYEQGAGGLLPPLANIAAHLQISLKNLKKTLHKLNKLGMVHETAQGWVVDRLLKSPDPSERVEPMRYARKRHAPAVQRRKAASGAGKQAIPYYD